MPEPHLKPIKIDVFYEKKNEGKVALSSNIIQIDHLDGFDFQKFVSEIFKLKGYSIKEMAFTGDEGKDIVIEKDKERIIIECKHHKSSIGRPVIQKLHSAIITDGRANKGMVITSGSFSKQAIDYVYTKNLPIELIDLLKLRKMASEINIRILVKGEKIENNYFPIENQDVTFKHVINSISQSITSSKPLTLAQISKSTDWHINLMPIYRIKYTIDHETNTTVGTVYQVHENGILYLDAKNLKNMMQLDCLNNLHPISSGLDSRISKIATKFDFLNIHKEIYKNAIELIISKYTKNIRYMGRNNVTYIKTCSPKSKDVSINGIIPVYVPIQSIGFNVLNKSYKVSIIENGSVVPFFVISDLNECEVCKETLNSSKLLCNDCGSVAHEPKWWKRSSHSFICESCGKTICRNCGYWTRKWLLMKKVLCEECTMKEKNNKKITKIPSLS